MYRLIILFLLVILTSTTTYAENFSDDRKFYLHKDIDELGTFNWGNFLFCISTAKFPGDEIPREIDRKISRLIITTIQNHTWVFSVKEDESKIELETITVDTHKYYTLEDKRRLFLRLVGNCQL